MSNLILDEKRFGIKMCVYRPAGWCYCRESMTWGKWGCTWMSECVLWAILPVGLRRLTGRLFQPNPFLFTLWIIGLVGKAALVEPKPKKAHAGGCPACRAWKLWIPHKCNVFFFFYISPFWAKRAKALDAKTVFDWCQAISLSSL